MNKILLMIVALIGIVGFSGCAMGPSTYEVWKRNMDISIGMKLYKADTLYIAEGKKKCMIKIIIFI